MTSPRSWVPQQRHFDASHVLKLADKLGVADYEALRALSIQDPATYWRAAAEFLGMKWDKAPEAYADLSRGKEFPAWWPGGRLNWVNTVLAFAEAPDSAARTAIIDETETGAVRKVSYGALAAMTRRFAHGLRVAGVGRGDRVGLLMDNSIEATVTVLAVAYIGAIIVPLFSGFGDEAIVSRLQPSGAKLLIASTGFPRRGKYVDVRHIVHSVCQQLPSIQKVIWKPAPGAELKDDELDWHEVELAGDDHAQAESMDAMDPFMVIYTSGTTGKPKGPVHTHGGFPFRIAHDSAVHFNVGAGDVFFWPADMGWIAGTLILSTALLRGATLLLYSGAPDFPDWSRMSKLIEDHKVTHFGSAPTLIRGMAAHEALGLKYDRSSLQLLITAGEVIDAEHFQWYQDRFAGNGSPVINYTGGTEVSGALLSSVQVKPIAPGSFNTSSPGIDVVITDHDGKPVSGEVGELVIRAPFIGMTASFWQDDERYLDSYWRTIPGSWVHGDLAIQSADGAFVVVGRSDDTLKVAGKRLGPAEVEEIVLEMAEISEAAAVGVSDPVKGQKLLVFVRPVPDFNGGEEDLAKRVATAVGQHLGKPFTPSKVHVVAQLPKTRSGKIMRRLIRQAYVGDKLGDLSSLDNPAVLEDIKALGLN